MKKKILFLFPFLFLFLTSGKVNSSSSYIIMESSSMRVLEGKNIHDQKLIASTAKILTAMTVIENYDLEEEIIVSKEDISEVGSKVYLKENEKIKRRDLLYALMLRSANDAASALSKNNSREFIYLMNETAKKIGMNQSVFENASGLDEREYNLSTAYDMALLSVYASKNETFKEIAGAHTYSCKTESSSYAWTNKHKLVQGDESFLWGKTGYTKKSKRILVSNYEKGNMNLIVVTLNVSDDWNFHKLLVNSVNSYDFLLIYKKGIYDTKLDVSYYLYIERDIVLPLKKEEFNKISIKFYLYEDSAIMNIYLEKELICKYNLLVYDKNSLDLELLLEVLKE